MDKIYADTVRLLLAVAPDVFKNSIFAMKGGTAINLFVRDMPRLSVDIDLVFTNWEMPRSEALVAIADEIEAIKQRLNKRGLNVHSLSPNEFGDSKLMVNDRGIQVKVEVNHVFRGMVLPVEPRSLVASTAAAFSAELEVPILAVDELYGSKLVAAFDRQHPRDLFDVLQVYESGGITEGMVECFVTYLAGHNRPTHEVLFANPRDISTEYESAFVGMTIEPVSLEAIESTRDRVFEELPLLLSDQHKEFLSGFTRAEPDWTLLKCPHAAELPAIHWKLRNLKKFKKENPAGFVHQVSELESRF